MIMDGNGRWAKSRNRPRVFGHKSGAARVRELVETAGEAGISYLTLYAFSEENWQRPRDEVNALFSLLNRYLKQEVSRLHESNVRLRAIGNRSKLPMDCQNLLMEAESRTCRNTGLQLILAISYSARDDLVNACKKIAQDAVDGNILPYEISEDTLSSYLSTSDIPDPDLLIRTSGEKRISNFLLWEMAYTEFVFCDKNWPEFSKKDFSLALEEYACRDRRFGTLNADSSAIRPRSFPRSLAYHANDDIHENRL